MRYRNFGDTDLVVSEVGFGTWTLASDWWGEVADKDGLLRAAFDAGITFFDAAPVYGKEGAGETVLDRVPAGPPRRDRPHHEVRLRHRRGAEVPGPVGATARLGAAVDPRAARRVAAPARRRPHRPLPAAQHAHRADPRRRPLGDARRPQGVGQGPRARRRARSGHRLGRGGAAGDPHAGRSRRCRPCSTSSSRSPVSPSRPSRRCSDGDGRDDRPGPARVRHALGSHHRATPCSRPRTTGRTATARTCSTTSTRRRRSRSSGRARAGPSARPRSPGILANPAFSTVLPTCVTVEDVVEYAAGGDLPLTADGGRARSTTLRSQNFGITNRYEMPLKSSV